MHVITYLTPALACLPAANCPRTAANWASTLQVRHAQAQQQQQQQPQPTAQQRPRVCGRANHCQRSRSASHCSSPVCGLDPTCTRIPEAIRFYRCHYYSPLDPRLHYYYSAVAAVQYSMYSTMNLRAWRPVCSALVALSSVDMRDDVALMMTAPRLNSTTLQHGDQTPVSHLGIVESHLSGGI